MSSQPIDRHRMNQLRERIVYSSRRMVLKAAFAGSAGIIRLFNAPSHELGTQLCFMVYYDSHSFLCLFPSFVAETPSTH